MNMLPIAEFPGYSVTDDGRVWSAVKGKGKGRFLKPWLTRGGYPAVSLHRGEERVICKVHRLVAMAFVPNPENLPEVDHVDCNKENANASNLEWVTHAENICRARKNGLRPSMKPVLNEETGKPYFSCVEIKADGFDASHVAKAITGRYKTTGGCHWRLYQPSTGVII